MMSSYAEITHQRLPRRRLVIMQQYERRSLANMVPQFDSDHFFHVMGKGWYVEISGGELGPFKTHTKADQFLKEIS